MTAVDLAKEHLAKWNGVKIGHLEMDKINFFAITIVQQAEALIEAEKVILNHSEGCEVECDGDITEAKDWLAKYAGEK